MGLLIYSQNANASIYEARAKSNVHLAQSTVTYELQCLLDFLRGGIQTTAAALSVLQAVLYIILRGRFFNARFFFSSFSGGLTNDPVDPPLHIRTHVAFLIDSRMQMATTTYLQHATGGVIIDE